MKYFLKLISVLMIISLCLSAVPVSAANEKPFKGVWVSTVYNLDYPSKSTTDANTLMAEADKILDNCKEMGMTAVFLQVRPSGDALYESDIFPWSKYLTGTQGIAPTSGFDPLTYWIKGAHKRGMELHAWLNPYRVTKGGDTEWNSLAPDNPAKMHPEWTVKYSADGNYYLNPGLPEVRKLVIDGVVEIAENYDVDGIHFDDYFYPGQNFNDNDSFILYGKDFKSLDEWRINNVDLLIEGVYEAVKKVDKNIEFGVSPQGIWANKGNRPEGSDTTGSQSINHYADTRKWVKDEIIDYICPQIYWYIGQKGADYEIVTKWWADVVKGTDVKLYIGMADYKANSTNSSDPWYGISEIEKQIALNRAIPEVSGEVHFRYKFLVDNKNLFDLYKNSEKKTDTDPTVDTPVDTSKDTPTEKPDNNEVSLIKSRTPAKDGSGTWILLNDGNYKFAGNSGTYATGWQKSDGNWFYFDKNGIMMTGWQKIDSSWFFFNGGGYMKTGWQKIDGSWFFFNGGGYMKTGWLENGGKWYFFNGGGYMQTGWELISNKWYYFMPDGDMAFDTITPDGYRLGKDGAMM